MTYQFEKLSREYATLWDTMEIVRSVKAIDASVKMILESYPAYAEVEKATGVPWFVTGIMDMREGGGRARTHLHNGDPLTGFTRQVPAKRPALGRPPFTFFASACDCHKLKEYDQIEDWSIEQMAFVFEKMNGWGYRNGPVSGKGVKRVRHPSMRSPYLWGGTNHQEPGKYVADHVFDKTVMDSQHGCMALLRRLAEICPEKVPLHSMHGATMDPTEPSPASNAKAVPAPSIVEGNETGSALTTGGLGSTGMAFEVSSAATRLASLGKPPTTFDVVITLLSSPTFFISVGLLFSSAYFVYEKLRNKEAK
jgi:lysozyme family protein